jgi:hypothetical protein
MFLLLTDETNIAAQENAPFFAYGGLIIRLDELSILDERIRATRNRFGYNPGETLKFNSVDRPRHVTLADATAAKNEVIAACIEAKCKFIAYVVLHAIARNVPTQKMVAWANNTVLGKFQFFLQWQNAYGIVAMDRLPDGAEFGQMVNKFSHGLLIDVERIALDRFKLFASTCINASHVSSAMDIALGSFRYCINQPRNIDAARAMLSNLSRMIWCERRGDVMHPMELGLIFRPREVSRADYRAAYNNLFAHIAALLADVQ